VFIDKSSVIDYLFRWLSIGFVWWII